MMFFVVGDFVTQIIERFQAMLKEGTLVSPSSNLIGYKFVTVEFGDVVVELEINEHHAGLFGLVHGGIICTIADAAMGFAHVSTLNEGEMGVTMESKINFFKAPSKGKLRAKGKIVQRSRKTSYVECEVLNDEDELIAKSNSTIRTITNSKPEM